MLRHAYEFVLWVGYACALGAAWVARACGHPSAEKLTRFCTLRSKAYLEENCLALERMTSAASEKTRVAWFHVASVGELEQAIPVARALHEKDGLHFVLTYYSPSTEPYVKNFPAVLLACGLPLDLRARQDRLVRTIADAVQLEALFFVRYDMWPGLLRSARARNVRMALLAATMRRTRGGLAGVASLLSARYVYSFLDYVFTVDASDVLSFERLAARAKVLHAGDPKWARARERADALRARGLSPTLQALATLCRAIQEHGGSVFVFGSPHAEEHDLALRTAALGGALVIYVPHDPSPAHVEGLFEEARAAGVSPLLFSELSLGEAVPHDTMPAQAMSPHVLAAPHPSRLVSRGVPVSLCRMVIVDAVGVLAEIYALADVAVVGGGFDGAVHNTLEPAAHPVPVLFGNRITRSPEAEKLVAEGAALAFSSPETMFQFLRACVRVSAAPAGGSAPPSGPRLAELRLRSLELFKQVPSTSEVVSRVLAAHA